MKKYLIAIMICCLAAAAGAQYEAPDPSRTVPSGRVLAVGRAFTGLSEGTAAIFTNPAGLAKAEIWQATSMSGKFLDEYSYLSFSGVYPTPAGNFGLGFMGSSIAGAYSTMKDPNSSDSDPIYIIDPSQPPINYTNNVTILTYGQRLGRFLKRFGWEDNLSLGANLKLFQSALTGDGITQGSASGVEMDLGALYEAPWRWLSLGATLQNALPSSLGGRLRYETGHEEAYPALLKLGAAFKLFGRQEALRTLGDHQVTLLLDYYMYPTLSSIPATLHYGVEYKPAPLIAVRAGIDQDASGNGRGTGVGTVSNLTGGVGLDLNGFSFDYAYRSFAGVSGVSNNFVSISYSPPLPSQRQAGQPIVIKNPPDRLVTFNDTVSIEGQINSDQIKFVTVAGLAPKLSPTGSFTRLAELKTGKNAVPVVGYSADRKEFYGTRLRALRLVRFPDVPADYWVAQPVSLLAMSSIISGYPDGTFRPEGHISRAEMCSLLIKSRTASAESPAGAAKPGVFKDVSQKHWAAAYIAQAASLGVVKGYPGNVFKPNGRITRAEGLAMIARFAGISEEAYNNQFRDLGPGFWGARQISGAYAAGLLDFLRGKQFEPNKYLLRAETVEMLRRTAPVVNILNKDLLNWDSY